MIEHAPRAILAAPDGPLYLCRYPGPSRCQKAAMLHENGLVVCFIFTVRRQKEVCPHGAAQADCQIAPVYSVRAQI